MILNRYNAMGLCFQLGPISRTQTSVVLVGTDKKIIVDAPIEDMNQGWYYWMNGKFVQDAFPTLTAEQREFLMTGITPTEWNEIFSEEEN